MKVENNLIVFENLSTPSLSVIGEKEVIKAVIEGNPRADIDQLKNIEEYGKSIASNLKNIFN